MPNFYRFGDQASFLAPFARHFNISQMLDKRSLYGSSSSAGLSFKGGKIVLEESSGTKAESLFYHNEIDNVCARKDRRTF